MLLLTKPCLDALFLCLGHSNSWQNTVFLYILYFIIVMFLGNLLYFILLLVLQVGSLCWLHIHVETWDIYQISPWFHIDGKVDCWLYYWVLIDCQEINSQQDIRGYLFLWGNTLLDTIPKDSLYHNLAWDN